MKRLLCILTLLCVLAGLCVLPLSAAEGNVTVRYGAENLSLTLIDPLDDAGLTFDGSFGFGVATVQNGEIRHDDCGTAECFLHGRKVSCAFDPERERR